MLLVQKSPNLYPTLQHSPGIPLPDSDAGDESGFLMPLFLFDIWLGTS